jgi:methionyl aminopeptidase
MTNRPKTQVELEHMRVSGKMLSKVLNDTITFTRAGMTTADIAIFMRNELKSLGGKPSIFGYGGFPDVACISVNDEVIHGIPGKRIINESDIVSIDFVVSYNGMLTDAARTYIVGSPKSKEHVDMIQASISALECGVYAARAGAKVGDISAAIQSAINPKKYGIVREFVGHGVGHEMHESPEIPNYGKKATGMILSAGMTIAIEPMITLGSNKIYIANDNWTVITQDGSMSAHYEDTILINEIGDAEVLTRN